MYKRQVCTDVTIPENKPVTTTIGRADIPSLIMCSGRNPIYKCQVVKDLKVLIIKSKYLPMCSNKDIIYIKGCRIIFFI